MENPETTNHRHLGTEHQNTKENKIITLSKQKLHIAKRKLLGKELISVITIEFPSKIAAITETHFHFLECAQGWQSFTSLAYIIDAYI